MPMKMPLTLKTPTATRYRMARRCWASLAPAIPAPPTWTRPPEFLDQDRQARRGPLRRLWGYGCLLGLIALGLQLLYAYRVDIANSVPALRPALEAACRSMGCTVGYARRLERIAISASSLQPPPGAAAIDDGRSRLVLNLMLRNRYDKPQHWPALVLDLTDLSDTVVRARCCGPRIT